MKVTIHYRDTRFSADPDSRGAYYLEAYNEWGEEVGSMTVEYPAALAYPVEIFDEDEVELLGGVVEDGFLEVPAGEVTHVHVEPHLRKRGIATQLYEKAAQLMGEEGLALASDTTRSRFSEGFWEKQWAHDRALAIEDDRGAAVLDDDGSRDPDQRWDVHRYILPPTAAVKKGFTLRGWP